MSAIWKHVNKVENGYSAKIFLSDEYCLTGKENLSLTSPLENAYSYGLQKP